MLGEISLRVIRTNNIRCTVGIPRRVADRKEIAKGLNIQYKVMKWEFTFVSTGSCHSKIDMVPYKALYGRIY